MKENRGIISLALKISWNKHSQGSKNKENLRTLKKKTPKEGGEKNYVHGLVRLILQNGHPSKSNLQIQCDCHQNPNAILHRN